MATAKEKALMAALGISLEEAQQTLGAVDGSNEVAAFREAELFLTTLEHPDYAVLTKCKNCGEEFQSSYRYNKHCSKECLKASLAKRGIDWDSDKSDVDRWKGMPPSVIAPDTLKVLRAWAEQLLSYDPHMATVAIVAPPVVAAAARTREDEVMTPWGDPIDLSFLDTI